MFSMGGRHAGSGQQGMRLLGKIDQDRGGSGLNKTLSVWVKRIDHHRLLARWIQRKDGSRFIIAMARVDWLEFIGDAHSPRAVGTSVVFDGKNEWTSIISFSL